MELELLAASDDGSFALVSVLIAVYLAMIAFGVFIYAKIVARSGYPWPWVFIMFVPIVNIVMLCIFALRTWPVERELELTRRALEAATGSPFPPGSQLPAYGRYQIGSGLAYGAYPQDAGQGYASGLDYSASSYGSAHAEPFSGDPAQQTNPYSGFAPQADDSGNPYAPKP